MKKLYDRPELEVFRFAMKESIAADEYSEEGEILSSPDNIEDSIEDW